jgi:carbon-monoxide dehydrogenase large subunit
VAHVFTFADLERWMKPLPLFGAIPPGLAARVAVTMKQPHQLAMCRDEARHVGEIVAMVLAGSRAVAEDGAELVEVDYEPLPPLADVEAAARPDAPVLYPAWGDNIALSFKTGFGDVEAAFRQADARVRERFVIPRYVGMPIETRGVVAQWDPRDGTPTWNGTQVVHFVQQGLVAALGLPPHKVRVVAPDVGGGFGTKANGYAEDLLIPAAAILARRPVKWTEDRREHMMGSAHARAQVHDIEIAARRDGTMLAVRDRIWVDLGAYKLVGHRAAVQHGGAPAGPASDREPRRRVPGRGDHQDAERALSRGGPPRDRVRDGPHRGLPGAGARDGSGRAAPAQLPVRGRSAVRAADPVSRRQPAGLRQR